MSACRVLWLVLTSEDLGTLQLHTGIHSIYGRGRCSVRRPPRRPAKVITVIYCGRLTACVPLFLPSLPNDTYLFPFTAASPSLASPRLLLVPSAFFLARLLDCVQELTLYRSGKDSLVEFLSDCVTAA